ARGTFGLRLRCALRLLAPVLRQQFGPPAHRGRPRRADDFGDGAHRPGALRAPRARRLEPAPRTALLSVRSRIVLAPYLPSLDRAARAAAGGRGYDPQDAAARGGPVTTAALRQR